MLHDGWFRPRTKLSHPKTGKCWRRGWRKILPTVKRFEQMRDVWEHLGVVEPNFSPEEEYAYRAELTRQREAERKISLKALFNLFFKPDKKLAAAFICLAILVLFCLPVIKLYSVDPVDTFYSYNTATGEQKNVTLSDGSVLKMNVSSSISVYMGKGYRRVQMNNGEVFFNVKPDPERPFEVRTSKGVVRVIGTAFNVRDRKGQVAVDVDRGKVRVQNSPKGAGDMRVRVVTLLSGQGADLDSTGRFRTRTHLQYSTCFSLAATSGCV